MIAAIESLIAVFIVSLASLVGIFTLILRKNVLESALIYLVAFALGTLLGAVFFDLLPEVLELRGGYDVLIPIGILVGMLSVYLLENLVRWHHHHSVEHPLFNSGSVSGNGHEVKPYVYNNLIGDGLHNFIDGLAMAVAFNVSFELGFVAFLAILVHELAQEIGDFSILIKGGLSVRKALVFNFISALTSVFGALIGIFLVNFPEFSAWVNIITAVVLSFTMGIFLYLSLSDLVPELHEEVKLSTSIFVVIVGILGVVIIYLVTLLET